MSAWAIAQSDVLGKARAAAQAGHYTEAIATLERVLEREPGNLAARVEYGRVLSWAGRYNESLHAYDAVLTLDPGNQEAQLGRARVLYWTGHLNAAARALRGMEGTEARLLLAEVERARGHNDRALAALNTLGSDGMRLRESIRQEARPERRAVQGEFVRRRPEHPLLARGET